MKQIIWITGSIGVILLFFYARQSNNTQTDVRSVPNSLLSASVLPQVGLPLSGDKARQARLKRGDTLALDQEELTKLLPSTIFAYQSVGVPNSSSVHLMGNSYTVAEQLYQKGSQKMKVSIADYNAAYTLYNVATAVAAAGITIETHEQLVQGFDLGFKEAKGWETYDKKEQKAIVTVGIAERFLVTIEASDQPDIQELEIIARKLDLHKLSD